MHCCLPWCTVLGPDAGAATAAEGVGSHRQAPKALLGSLVEIASPVPNKHALPAPLVAGLPSASRLARTGGTNLWLRQRRASRPAFSLHDHDIVCLLQLPRRSNLTKDVLH